jgi:predicted ATPase with chaperone activity
MLLEIPREPVDRLLDYSAGESSEILRDKVVNARAIQQKRFAGT